MGSVLDAILLSDFGEEQETKPRKRRLSDLILSGGPSPNATAEELEAFFDRPPPPTIEREFVETGAIDTRTDRPQVMFRSTGQMAAGFGTLAKTSFVDDPQAKINIFAEARGISPDRYRIIGGEVVFKGDDDKWYSETKQTTFGKLKRTVAETAGDLPELVGAGVGAITAGVPGVLAGSVAGRATKQAIGQLVFDEPRTAKQNVRGLLRAELLGTVGAGGGKALVKGIDVGRRGMASRLLKTAGRVATKEIDIGKMKAIEALAKKHKIVLFTPQTTGSPQIIAKFNLLGDLPVTADKIGRARMKQFAEVNDAVNEWLGTFGGPFVTPGSAGRRGVEAAKETLSATQLIRKNRASPIYDKAYAEAPKVNVKPVVDLIDSKLATAKGKIRANLIRAKNTLQKPDLPKKKKVLLLDAKGKPIISEPSFDTSLRGLHDANLEFGDIINTARETSLGNTSKRNMIQIKKSLLKQMDEASPDYKKARNIFSEESITPEGFKKSKIEAVSKLEGDAVEKASFKIFAPGQSSPEIIDITKKAIIKHGGQGAWDDLLKVHLKKTFRDVIKTRTQNIGGQLHKRLWLDMDQRAILKTAMNPKQFNVFKDFMEVLRRTGLTAGKESTTATRQASLAQLTSEAKGVLGKLGETIAMPLRTPKRVAAQMGVLMKVERYQRKLAEAMISEKSAAQLKQMIRLNPRSQRFVIAASAFFGVGITKAAVREIKRGVLNLTQDFKTEKEKFQRQRRIDQQ